MSHVPPLSHTFEMLERIKRSTMSMSGIGIALQYFPVNLTPLQCHSTIHLFESFSYDQELWKDHFLDNFFWLFFGGSVFSWHFLSASFWLVIFFWTVLSQFCSKLWVGNMISLLFRFLVFCVVSTFLIIFYFWIFSFCEIDGIWPTLRPPTPPLVSYI